MPAFSDNRYIQSLLDNLIASYETEINYTPIEIELDSQQISPKDIESLLTFVTANRKRLFIFKLPENQFASSILALTARRSVLNKTAETILQSTSNEPTINPLKKELSNPSNSIRAGIQIQRSFEVPKPPIALKETRLELVEQSVTPDIVLIAIDLPELPVLSRQLNALGIDKLEEAAALKIKEHIHAFTDGIIPGNLPKGFYINQEKHALYYTDTPCRVPSALAPTLEKTSLIQVPTIDQIQRIVPPSITPKTIAQLLNSRNKTNQKNALISVLPAHTNELSIFFQLLKPKDSSFIVPLLAKMFLLGGEAHASLFARLLNTCLNKKVSLEFLKNPAAHDAFLSPRGIKNLQKLLHLPAEQREWWNTLAINHMSNNQHQFDFNNFFEAYTQIFLPRIAEKNLTLPNPCPIKHHGHLLITLNRVLDVLEHAENPQEQCMNLAHLNWGPTGVHYAMTQNTTAENLKQVVACMKLENPEDKQTNPELIFREINNERLNLKPWLFRYMGQHWNAAIRLTDIQSQLDEIEKLISWTPVEKNQLIFILTCTFSAHAELNAEQWKETLTICINRLQGLNQNDRSDLLQELSRAFRFKPSPSLEQIKNLIEQCIELKTAFPGKQFKNELILPLISCLEHEGFELFYTLEERIEKTDETPDDNQFALTALATFTTILQSNRHNLPPEVIQLLAKLDEPTLAQASLDNLILSFKNLQQIKGDGYYHLVLSALSQINISKSQPLPDIEQIQLLLQTLSESPEQIPVEHKTLEKQEAWLKEMIIEKNILPGCVLGNGDISKLDDLIVDALVDAVKKRSTAFRVDQLKDALLKNLQSFVVPQQLRDQLNAELIPLFDALNDLVNLLQTPNPKFPEVIEKLRYFEETKPKLLEGVYGVGLLGRSKGEYILSYLLTGQKKEEDNTTGGAFALILSKLHGLFIDEMTAFFNNPQNKNIVKDLDLKTSLSWMAAFNDTHSLTFFFKEELIQKKVLPALRKTLVQLNTQDPIFEKTILDEAAHLIENEPSDQSLQRYKNKIEAIANYLNLLIDIKEHNPEQFNSIYKQLNSGALSRINYTQKQVLISKLLQAQPDSLDLYFKLLTQALDENPDADTSAIDRAINGLVTLFNLSDLELETQTMFFKMSMAHNLKSPSPFPLTALNELKKSDLPEKTKSLIIKQIIFILSQLRQIDSPELIQSLVHETQTFLTHNPGMDALCIALLKRISRGNPTQDFNVYPNILQLLASFNEEKRAKLATILTGLARSKKDDTVNLSVLLEITKGLARRSSADLEQVLHLFTTTPYPIAQNLNAALLAHGSEKLEAYCLSFDTNPFAKNGEKRALEQHFATDRIQEALVSLTDLVHEVTLPPGLQLQLAKQLTYIETLGYTDPLNPDDFQELKKLTSCSRHDLKERASILLNQLRLKTLAPDQIELAQLELLAYLREIYFRTTGLFPNTTQMLVLLLSLRDPSSNLLMRIKTGEGKSINTPMLSVLQWTQGGTVDQCTANPTLLIRDYENSCEPFFNFLGIKSTIIQSNSAPEEYQLNGINCSTVEDMSIFRLAAKESKKEAFIENGEPIHVVLDECDDALLDQTTLFKLVAEISSQESENNSAQWIYPLAYQFINLPAFRNIELTQGTVWDEEEDLEQFRLFLNKEVNEKFNGNAEKQNFLMASTNTQLMQWINASCKAAKLIENKHFIIQPIKEKDDAGNETIKKIVCVPLIRSTPKTGSIFTEGVQQALHARLIAERKDQAIYFVIDADPPVLASQSARGLIKFYQNTKGRLLGISGTPGDQMELKNLNTLLGTQAIGIEPYAGNKRKKHAPVFTFSREESINAIYQAIDNLKLPVTKPTMEINPDVFIQTHEEREAFITQTRGAIEQWSSTQTQPILIINEDFDDAHTLGARFEHYKQEGFKIQVVTGKESPEELDRIIKQAGQVNTITIGTAMLAKGIDINTGNHPRGLIVIQTYTDTERMTTQIAGRSARNGKPGGWLPIYQIKPPQSLWEQILYYIFPWYRQSNNEYAVEQLKSKIKLQATLDRLYTQAIDEVQQTFMQQIEAWEGLLFELYPTDFRLQYELYQWRETFLSELTRLQETTITQNELEQSIHQFKNSACKLWETLKEDKWVAKAQKMTEITTDQALKLNYLKQLDLTQELNIQLELQQKRKLLTEGTGSLMHQNIETMIRDKAGVVLGYTKPEAEEKKRLELAQSKQLLPHLIGDFCAVYPAAIKTLIPQNQTQNSSFFSGIINSIIDKVVEQKNKILQAEEQQEITQSVIQFYQKELTDADQPKIQALLNQIKPLLLNHAAELKQSSLVEQFKMQGLALTFCDLYQHSGLPEDRKLTELKVSYNDEIMKKLADHLLEEFAWVRQSPEPFHAFFERSVAKQAAYEIHELAEQLSRSPKDEKKIHALYAALEKHRLILEDKYLFSIGHSSPRDVIKVALDAINALHIAPHCAQEFRAQCHDAVLSTHHLDQFRECLEDASSDYTYRDAVWEHLKTTLSRMSNKSKINQSHVIHELNDAIERFKTYEAYHPYKHKLNMLQSQLVQSLEHLQKEDGIKQDVQESLLTQKTTQFANLFNVDAGQIRLQSGYDGIQSYIELQIQNAPLKEGFTGYQSAFFTRVESEKGQLVQKKSSFKINKEALLLLSDLRAIDVLSPKKKTEFEKLFKLKTLLELDWNDNPVLGTLPDHIQEKLAKVEELKQWNWHTNPQIDKIWDENPEKHFLKIIKKQTKQNENLEEIKLRVLAATDAVNNQKQVIAAESESILIKQERLKQPDCTYWERTNLNIQLIAQRTRAYYYQTQLSGPEKTLNEIQEEEDECKERLEKLDSSLDKARTKFVTLLTSEAKQMLANYLTDTSKNYVEEVYKEFQATDNTIESIQKTELGKSRYQTRRFFNSTELLRYEARLAKEEELIPQRRTANRNVIQDNFPEEERSALGLY